MPEDLSLVSTKDMIDELARRTSNFVVVMQHADGDRCSVHRHYCGNHHLCMGMAFDVAAFIQADMMQKARANPEWGD